MPVMRRTLPLIALILALVGAAPAAAASFSSGVAAGEVTSRSAVLWTRAPRSGIVRVIVIDRDAVIPTGKFRTVRARGSARVVKLKISGLAPGHHHIFRFIQGSAVSDEGQFETAPRTSSNHRVQFVVNGGATHDARPRTNSDGDLPATDFRIDLGAPGPATTSSEQRRVAATRAVRGATGAYYLWNGDGAGRGRTAFLQRNPAVANKLGLFRHTRWGRNVDVFLLDERSFRSADARGACPSLGGADEAPTLPDIIRATSGIPSLANPVAAACRSTIAAPARRFLGDAQSTALLKALKASRARFHVIVSPVPLGQYYVDPYDRAEGFAGERLRLLDALRNPANGLKNVVVLSGAAGGTLTSDVRLQTLEAGGAITTGVREFATGTSRDGLLGSRPSAAAWQQILHRPLPNGVGLGCTALSTTSYLRVTVTTKALTVTLRDGRRRPVVDDVTHQPCATSTIPFTR
jgi:phosphodiesterase/alkaline phosphatase D-like protein